MKYHSPKLDPTSFVYVGKKDKKYYHLNSKCPHLKLIDGSTTIAAARREGRSRCLDCWNQRLEDYRLINKDYDETNNFTIGCGIFIILPVVILLYILFK
jgi:hypothetical protein